MGWSYLFLLRVKKSYYLVFPLKRSYTYWIYNPLGFFLHSWHRNHLTVHIPGKPKAFLSTASQDPFRQRDLFRCQHTYQYCILCLNTLALWNLTLRQALENPAQGTKPKFNLLYSTFAFLDSSSLLKISLLVSLLPHMNIWWTILYRV